MVRICFLKLMVFGMYINYIEKTKHIESLEIKRFLTVDLQAKMCIDLIYGVYCVLITVMFHSVFYDTNILFMQRFRICIFCSAEALILCVPSTLIPLSPL